MKPWWDRILFGDQRDQWTGDPALGPRRIRPQGIAILVGLAALVLLVIATIASLLRPPPQESAITRAALEQSDPRRCIDGDDGSSRALVAAVNRALGDNGPLVHVSTNISPAAQGHYQVAMTYRPKHPRVVGAAENTALASLNPATCAFTLQDAGDRAKL